MGRRGRGEAATENSSPLGRQRPAPGSETGAPTPSFRLRRPCFVRIEDKFPANCPIPRQLRAWNRVLNPFPLIPNAFPRSRFPANHNPNSIPEDLSPFPRFQNQFPATKSFRPRVSKSILRSGNPIPRPDRTLPQGNRTLRPGNHLGGHVLTGAGENPKSAGAENRDRELEPTRAGGEFSVPGHLSVGPGLFRLAGVGSEVAANYRWRAAFTPLQLPPNQGSWNWQDPRAVVS